MKLINRRKKMFYVYIECPYFNKYRWICRFKDLHTALKSCNRKRNNGINAFVSDKSDLGISNVKH